MIKVQMSKLKINNNFHDSEIPKQCPICGDKNTPSYIDHAFIKMPNEDNTSDEYVNYYGLYRFRCMNCDEIFLCVILFDVNKTSRKWSGKILQTIPNSTSPNIPEYIKKFSPRCYEVYKGAFLCEEYGYLELAGAGYRNCMEILIKDYLIKEMNDNDPKLPSMKLVNAIGKLPHSPLKKSADVVRIIGNNLSHYDNQLTPADFNTLKNYLNIVIAFIQMLYEANHPDPKFQDSNFKRD